MIASFVVEEKLRRDYPSTYPEWVKTEVGDRFVIDTDAMTVNGVELPFCWTEVGRVQPDGSVLWIMFIYNPWACVPALLRWVSDCPDCILAFGREGDQYSADPYYGSAG